MTASRTVTIYSFDRLPFHIRYEFPLHNSDTSKSSAVMVVDRGKWGDISAYSVKVQMHLWTPTLMTTKPASDTRSGIVITSIAMYGTIGNTSICVLVNHTKKKIAVVEIRDSAHLKSKLIGPNDSDIEHWLHTERGLFLKTIREARLVERFRSLVSEWGLTFPLNPAILPYNENGLDFNELSSYPSCNAWDILLSDNVP